MGKEICLSCNKQFSVKKITLTDDGKCITTCPYCKGDIVTDEDVELDLNQLARLDQVYNAVYDVCKVIYGDNLTYDMSYIGEVTDFIVSTLSKYDKDHKIYYPGIIIDGKSEVVEVKDFCNDDDDSLLLLTKNKVGNDNAK